MLKSVVMSSLAIALGLTAWLLPMRGEQATAQSGPLHILVVEYDIVPAEIDKYLTAIKELGAAAVKEPGFRQLSIAVRHWLALYMRRSTVSGPGRMPGACKMFRCTDSTRSVGATVGLTPRAATQAFQYHQYRTMQATALLRFWDMACSFVFEAPCQILHWRGRSTAGPFH